MKIWVFVCARTPVSPGFSVVTGSLKKKPPPGGVWQYPSAAAISASTNTGNLNPVMALDRHALRLWITGCVSPPT